MTAAMSPKAATPDPHQNTFLGEETLLSPPRNRSPPTIPKPVGPGGQIPPVTNPKVKNPTSRRGKSHSLRITKDLGKSQFLPQQGPLGQASLDTCDWGCQEQGPHVALRVTGVGLSGTSAFLLLFWIRASFPRQHFRRSRCPQVQYWAGPLGAGASRSGGPGAQKDRDMSFPSCL